MLLFALVHLFLLFTRNTQSHVQILQPVNIIRKVLRFNVVNVDITSSTSSRKRQEIKQIQKIKQHQYIETSYENQEIKRVLNYLKNEIGQKFNDLKIIGYEVDQHNQRSYRLTCQIPLHKNQRTLYELIVKQSQNKLFSIEKSQYVDFKITEQTYQKIKNYKNASQSPYMKQILYLLNEKFIQQLGKQISFVQCNVYQPFYQIILSTQKYSKINIKLVYDFIRNAIDVRQIKYQTYNNHKEPVSSEKNGNDIQNINKVIQNEYSEPSYTYELNSYNAISKVNSASDPFIIPLVTELQLQEMKEQVLQKAIKFLVKKVSITDSFKIVMVNKIRYAFRIVVSLQTDNQLFEALISYIYAKSDRSSAEMQLLQWKQLSDISDVDPDIFVRYYKEDINQAGRFLQRAIVRAFSNQKSVSQYKKLIKVEKKFTFDGVYFRIILLSMSDVKVQTTLYWIPESDYLQIYKYQILDSIYDLSTQKVANEVPFSSKQYSIVKNTLSRFKEKLQNSVITFLGVTDINIFKLWRIIFMSEKGKLEILVSIDKRTGVSTIIRWEKLQDGYMTFKCDDYLKDQSFNKLKNIGENYVKFKLQQEYKSRYFQLKVIPGLGKYYKFIFQTPFPFILTLDESEDKRINIRGMDRIQIVSTSQFYNDRLFSGYTSMNPKLLKYDPYYQQFKNAMLFNQKLLKQNTYQIKAAFKKVSSSYVSYKIIYLFNGKRLYIGTFQKDDHLNQTFTNFEEYQQQIEQGDYRWKCQTNLRSGQCSKCEADNYILTVGRCYPKKPGCSFQISSTCLVCLPGYHRVRGSCSNFSQTTQFIQYSEEKSVEYDNNCLKFQHSVCISCAFRYYVHNGFCKKVEDSCKNYDKFTGSCINCYAGYYLTVEGCKEKSPLCQQMNTQNECIRCFQPYQLRQSFCVPPLKRQ